ncbi:MAG: translation initiation factor IF-2 [Candidatus Micrarchaeia archaeon]
MESIIRQPIVVVMGHVDHGKTSILDAIRKTSVHKREKGAITQHIGASEVPSEVIVEMGRSFLSKMNISIKIPGLLFIDTPGHEAFTTLRKRGGSISDIAILVVDAMQGFQPQTIESINILREYKTPFIVAMNKIDLVQGWKDAKTTSFMESFSKQSKQAQEMLDSKVYEVVSSLAEHGFNSDRFDRVSDFTKEIAIVPVSAKTMEGIMEILVMLSGLSQRFLEKNLYIDPEQPGRASIIEIKEEPGLGKTMDAVLYDGTIRVGDKIAFPTINGHKITHVRALLRPKPLDEMRDPRDKFLHIEFASAAAGLKISAPDIDDAIPGSTLLVVRSENDAVLAEVDAEISSILSHTSSQGVMVKADTLGSLEAAARLLSKEGISVRSMGIGNVSKKDVVECISISSVNPYDAVILAFNVKVPKDVEEYARSVHIPIFCEDVIYMLVENYTKWLSEKVEEEKRNVFMKLQPIGQICVLSGCCFRVSKPSVFGVRVMAGRITPGTMMVNEDGCEIGRIKSIQQDKVSLAEAREGMEVAISMDEPVYGRDIVAGNVLYTYVPKDEANIYLEKYNKLISDKETSLLMHILRITKQRY